MIRDMTDANAPSVSKQVDEIKKKSKKKMRNQSGENNEKQSNIRTLDDGLVVEYLSMGNNDAKVASDGCKVAAFSSLQSFGYAFSCKFHINRLDKVLSDDLSFVCHSDFY
jgi:hypothetical protein